MPSTPLVLAAALAAVLAFTAIGLALTRALVAAWAPRAAIAPALGWAVFTALSYPLQTAIGFTRPTTAALLALAVGAAGGALLRRRGSPDARGEDGPGLPAWAYPLAAAVALIPLIGVLPKVVPHGVLLGATAFDHTKIAMVDEMARQGLPPGNPFWAAGGGRGSLPYYLLWHFGAAQLSLLAGTTGWEADAAMTGFTAYASLLLMMGLALRLHAWWGPRRSGGRVGPAGAMIAVAGVAALSLSGALRPLIEHVIKQSGEDGLLSQYPGLAGWMVQSSWAPQHLAGATCALLVVLLLSDLAERPRPRSAALMGALAAAGFGSSAWVGGVAFTVMATGVGVLGLTSAEPGRRLGYLAAVAGAGVVALVLSVPIALPELGLAAAHGPHPIAFHPYEVLGDWTPARWRRALDWPAYWTVLLPVELTAIYPVGMVALALLSWKAAKTLRGAPGDARWVLALAVSAVLSFGVTWLWASTLANNDLGWRAMLAAVLALTSMAAAAVARWIEGRNWVAAVAALLLLGASTPDTLIKQNFVGLPSPQAAQLAQTPALWAAVRRYAGPTDRVADNPFSLAQTTKVPANAGWALISNRSSCFGAWELVRVASDLPPARVDALAEQVFDVFDGSGDAGDVHQMAYDYGCRVVALVPQDGAWTDDPFSTSLDYRLAEATQDWRIYVSTAPRPPPKRR